MTSVRRITSSDVAREAGVSRATVSYVLNDNPHQTIPLATRQRVFDAAARLDYSPSVAARMLRGARSEVVVCLLPDWPTSLNFLTAVEFISDFLARHSLTLVTHAGCANAPTSAGIWRTITPAAVVTFSNLDPQTAAAIRSSGTEVVLCVYGGDRSRQRAYAAEQRQIGRMQVAYLVGKGHRRLGFAATGDTRLATMSDLRLDGVRKACLQLGLDEPLARVVEPDADEAALPIAKWVRSRPRITGLACANDDVALAALAGMRRHGLRAPDDYAVIGVDDSPAGRLAAPPLTTVRIDVAYAGEQIGRAIVNALAGRKTPPVWSRTPAQVIERESA